MASPLDLTDLIRGEGEWKNMQEIVRRTFKICFDQIQKQNEQITKLAGSNASLRVQLASKPDSDEVAKIIESKQKKPIKNVSRDEIDRLTHNIANMRSDLERKAGINYVDDSLRRKIDKSDILVHNLSKITASQFAGDICTIHSDVETMKNKVDSKTQKLTDSINEVRLQYASEVNGLRTQVNQLESLVTQFQPRNEIVAMIDRKQDSAELDVMISRKAENSALVAATTRIEQTLSEHEKLITALRLKLDEDMLFHKDPLHRVAQGKGAPVTFYSYSEHRAAEGKFKSMQATGFPSHAVSTEGGEGEYKSGQYLDEFRREEGDIDTLLRSGRIEAIVHGLWEKMNSVTFDSQGILKEVSSFRSELKRVESTIHDFAGVSSVETLAAVVEEQRLRLDSLILGSTSIEPVAMEFQRIDKTVSDICAFLKMQPHQRPLPDQLAEAGQLIEVLSNRVADIVGSNGRFASRLDALEVNTRQLDTRIQVAEGTKDKIDRVHRVCDFSDTDFANIKELTFSLTQLWATVRAPSVLGERSTTRHSGPVVSLSERVNQVETTVTQSTEHIAEMDAKVTELKKLVHALSVSAVSSGSSHNPRQGSGAASYGTMQQQHSYRDNPYHQQSYAYQGHFQPHPQTVPMYAQQQQMSMYSQQPTHMPPVTQPVQIPPVAAQSSTQQGTTALHMSDSSSTVPQVRNEQPVAQPVVVNEATTALGTLSDQSTLPTQRRDVSSHRQDSLDSRDRESSVSTSRRQQHGTMRAATAKDTYHRTERRAEGKSDFDSDASDEPVSNRKSSKEKKSEPYSGGNRVVSSSTSVKPRSKEGSNQKHSTRSRSLVDNDDNDDKENTLQTSSSQNQGVRSASTSIPVTTSSEDYRQVEKQYINSTFESTAPLPPSSLQQVPRQQYQAQSVISEQAGWSSGQQYVSQHVPPPLSSAALGNVSSQRIASSSAYASNMYQQQQQRYMPNIGYDSDMPPAPLPAMSMLSVSRLVGLTSVEHVDERLEALRREKEVLKQRLISKVDI